MATHEVRVDYTRTLLEEPETGHNRWHPDIPPVVTCDPGDEVVLDTRDAFDGQMGPEATARRWPAQPERGPPPDRAGVRQRGRGRRPARGRDPRRRAGPLRLHRAGARLRVPARRVPRPLHGPLADPGRLGHLRFPEAAHPGSPFMGTIGLSPDRALLERTTPASRPPWTGAGSCSRPTPPTPSPRTRPSPPRPCAPSRGRPPATSTKQLGKAGCTSSTPTARLFSAGDAHFAQGDCETCGRPSRCAQR